MKKIAVMLPHAYRGGSLRAAKNMAKSIALAARQENEEIQVVFSYVDNGTYDLYQDFKDLKEYGVSLRPTIWKVFDRAMLVAASTVMNVDIQDLTSETYCLPTDGANDFFDCDLWIIISDRLPAPVFPARRYISVIYDYIQRYAPGIWPHASTWEIQEQILFFVARHAEVVFVTTPSTRADLIAYAGVSERKITLIEMDFEPVTVNYAAHKNIRKRPQLFKFKLLNDYFLWPTNLSFHKNHVNVLKAFEIYYQELGGSLDMVVTGFGSEFFDPEREFETGSSKAGLSYLQWVRELLKKNLWMKNHVHFTGNIPDGMYARLMYDAKFLLHPTLYDNGTFSVMEAAYFQKPSLSARYPAMEFINEKFNLNLSFFDPHNVHEMADAIFLMEKNHHKIRLPEQSVLMERSWKSFAPLLFQSIHKILGRDGNINEK